MLKEALAYLVGLKETKIYQVDGKSYSDNPLRPVEPERYYRDRLSLGSLDAIVQMIRAEIGDYAGICGNDPVFIRVVDNVNVEVFTRPDDREHRTYPYYARCIDAEFHEGWRGQDEAIIEIRSRFIPTEDSEYLLGLISRINADQGVQSTDNGVSQTVVTKQGVTLMGSETVKPRLILRPFRTFREVCQPESEFILRLDDKGRVGIFEADGGIWKMEAKDNIRAYFEDNLSDLIESGHVVVMV